MVEACVMKNDISLESFSSSSKSAENAEKHCSKNLEMKKKKKVLKQTGYFSVEITKDLF